MVCQMVCNGEFWELFDEGFYMMDVFIDVVVEQFEKYCVECLEDFFFFYLVYIVLYWLLYVFEEDIVCYEGCYDVGWEEF